MKKNPRGKIVVGNTKGEKSKFDFLIWSGLLSNFEEVAHVSVQFDKFQKLYNVI